jgi:hypothetical protein
LDGHLACRRNIVHHLLLYVQSNLWCVGLTQTPPSVALLLKALTRRLYSI